jgi:hypothetical protein
MSRVWPTVVRNARVVVPLAGVQSVVYLVLNHYPIRTSRELSMTALDRWIPFLPWTVWPYLLLILSEAALPLLIRRPRVFRRMLTAYALGMGLAISCYLFFPTLYVRPALPDDASCHSAVYRWLVTIDRPECCFPSGHILVPAIACWGLLADRHRWAPVLVTACSLFAVSVLTTKQHYLWDVLGALGVAAAAIVTARLLVPEEAGGRTGCNGDSRADKGPQALPACGAVSPVGPAAYKTASTGPPEELQP